MKFDLSEEHLSVQKAARDFAQEVLKPGVIERDDKQKFPAAEIKQLGELGFLGMMVNPKYGGGGMDAISYVLAMEEISKVDASCSVVMSVNNSLVCWGLEAFGTEEQKINPNYTVLDLDKSRIYRFIDSSDTTANFVPVVAASLLFNVNKKDQEKIGVNYPIQNEYGLGSPQSKNQKAITNEMIKDICIKLKVDRLGNISI